MRKMIHFLRIALLCLPAFTSAAPAFARGPALDGSVPLRALPREAQTTYERIFAGAYPPGGKDGSTFGNYEGALPNARRGYYHEFTVPTPGARNRGARRIVCGGERREWERNRPAVCYYTDNHYASFREIR